MYIGTPDLRLLTKAGTRPPPRQAEPSHPPAREGASPKMAAPYLYTPTTDLDFVLAEVARSLQLTAEQYALAVEHYTAVYKWLAAPESPLFRFEPWIYPQGSMALGTTVRPRTREEFDLDLVCQMLTTGKSAMEVFKLVYDRINANKTYAPMLKPMNRCVRLVYAHNFHLDIIPAEPDRARGGTAIQVPDRELKRWTPSNPRGYVGWYLLESQTLKALQARKLEPIPEQISADEKPPLTIAVQLMKRRRDIICDEKTAPRSVVITTLAAEYYSGTDDVFTALGEIVAGIQHRIDAAHPDRIEVCNPTNPDEKFCESFNPDGRYDAFKRYVKQLQRDIAAIAAARGRGLSELEKVLGDIFGEGPARTAIKAFATQHRGLRDAGKLAYTGAGLSIATPASGPARVSPTHQYYGEA